MPFQNQLVLERACETAKGRASGEPSPECPRAATRRGAVQSPRAKRRWIPGIAQSGPKTEIWSFVLVAFQSLSSPRTTLAHFRKWEGVAGRLPAWFDAFASASSRDN